MLTFLARVTATSLSTKVRSLLLERCDRASTEVVSSFAGDKVVYRRYASLFFIAGISSGENELITLEVIHRYVEVLDRYFTNVRSSLLCPPCLPRPARRS